jgi:hypothetical protein
VGDDAKQTDITDADSATNSLAAMAAQANVLEDKLKGIVDAITQHEAGKPWGTAPEYGAVFDAEYHQGKGGAGAQFVKDNVTILSAETADGVTMAHKALQGTVDLDHDIAGAFTVDGAGGPDGPGGSKYVGDKMNTTLKAWDQIHNDQSQGG